MKKFIITITLGLSLFSGIANGQTWDELFNQKQTQTRYLLEQIAALKVYIGHVEKTYKIAMDGLDFISKAANGEFDLHNDFFNSLKKINPEVARYPKVHEITLIQSSIISNQEAYRRQLDELGSLSGDETAYIKNVFERIEHDGKQVLDELKQVTSANKLEMKDDERIARINALHSRMVENLLINQQFSRAAVQLAAARKAEKDAITNSRVLNQIN